MMDFSYQLIQRVISPAGGCGALSKRHGQSALAFTTIEFIGAVVVMLVLAVIGLAGFRIYEREMPVKHVAKSLNHAFSSARTFAIAQNAVYSVQINLNFNNFWIDETNELGQTLLAKVVRPEPIGDQVEIDSIFFGSTRINNTQSSIPVRFLPDGSSDDVTVYLRLAAADSTNPANIYTIRLYGPTGLSRIFENQRLTLSALIEPTS